MNKKILSSAVVSLCFLTLTTKAVDNAKDPYTLIEHIKLDNGLTIILAPSDEATLTAVRLEVGVGWEAEGPTTWGLSHLLEHVLFRDKQLKDEMSYLQLIREAGGEANGSTEARLTSYFGSIPYRKGPWLLENFAKMLLEPNINESYVEKEKGTIELERGRPGPISALFGFNPMDKISPTYLKEPSFWESEFGLNFDQQFTITQEQLSNRKLTVEQVRSHYENYYYPSNMKLIITGKFDRDMIMQQITTKWAAVPTKSGKSLPPHKKPTPRMNPYVRTVVSEGTPYVYLGTKIWDVSVSEDQVIRSYMEYLAHRLMKEVRNLKGQTYSASSYTHIFKGYGYATISFQTQNEKLNENLSLAKKYLIEEAEAGSLSAEKIKEAKDLYLAGYQLRGREANNMMDFASYYNDVLDHYGKFTSPFAALQDISNEDYNSTLKKYFSAKQRYEYVSEPALLFPFDYYIMYFITAVLLFMGMQKILTKPFANDQIRWIRKVKYPPLKLLEAVLLVFAWYFIVHAQYAIATAFLKLNILQSNVIFSQYGLGLFVTITSLLIAQGLYSLVPRKLMVVGDHLLIKSISYYSRRIPLSEIAAVQTVTTLTFPFPLSRWFGKVKMRYFFFDLQYWKKGLMIELKDGRSYFFSVTNAEKAKSEINGLIANQNKSDLVRNEIIAA